LCGRLLIRPQRQRNPVRAVGPQTSLMLADLSACIAVIDRIGSDDEGHARLQPVVRCQLTPVTAGSMLNRATISSKARSLRSSAYTSATMTLASFSLSSAAIP